MQHEQRLICSAQREHESECIHQCELRDSGDTPRHSIQHVSGFDCIACSQERIPQFDGSGSSRQDVQDELTSNSILTPDSLSKVDHQEAASESPEQHQTERVKKLKKSKSKKPRKSRHISTRAENHPHRNSRKDRRICNNSETFKIDYAHQNLQEAAANIDLKGDKTQENLQSHLVFSTSTEEINRQEVSRSVASVPPYSVSANTEWPCTCGAILCGSYDPLLLIPCANERVQIYCQPDANEKGDPTPHDVNSVGPRVSLHSVQIDRITPAQDSSHQEKSPANDPAQDRVNHDPSLLANVASRLSLPPGLFVDRQCLNPSCPLHCNDLHFDDRSLRTSRLIMDSSSRFPIPHFKGPSTRAKINALTQTGLPYVHPSKLLRREPIGSRGSQAPYGMNRVSLGQSMCGLAWTYLTHTPADEDLVKAGVILCQQAPILEKRECSHSEDLSGTRSDSIPLVLSNSGSAGTPYVFHSDGKIIVIPSRFPEPDMRFIKAGPDYQGEVKLPEYQVVEMLGRRVWRHDRDLLPCGYPRCGLLVSDYNPHTIVCLDCGPKTTVRYCQLAHQIADIGRHYRECGSRKLLIKSPVDNSTTPQRFKHLCPAIRSIVPGNKSFFFHRQKIYSTYFRGVYTLFGPDGEEYPILWPETSPEHDRATQMTERLLNCAFYNHRNEQLMTCLYRILRKALNVGGKWSTSCRDRLVTQWKQEWDISLKRPDDDALVAKGTELYCQPAYNLPLCGCDWFGDELPPSQHISICPFGRGSKPPLNHLRGVGEIMASNRAIKRQVDLEETHNWALRAWRQRHSKVGSWRRRAEGEGFRGVTLEKGWTPTGGEGWTGWGMEAENQFEGIKNKSRM